MPILLTIWGDLMDEGSSHDTDVKAVLQHMVGFYEELRSDRVVLEEAEQERLEEHVKMFLLHYRCLNLEAAICCGMHEPVICGGRNP